MSKTELPITTKVAKASPESESVRTTIPKKVASELGVEVFDMLVWTIKEQNGKKVATLRKAVIE